MAIGGASGYLTVNPTHDYVGQALQGASDSFARVRAEKIAQERDRMYNEQNLQEQRRQDIKDAEEFSAKYPFVAMGNKSIDSKKRQDLETGKKNYQDAIDRYTATGDKKELSIANSILDTIKEIPEMGKALSLVVEGWQKNEADLNPSSLEKAKTILQKIQTDMVLDTDENGRSVYSIPKRDDAGNITGYLHKNISGEQLKELLVVEPNFNVTGEKGFVSQYIKSLPKTKKKEDVIRTKNGDILRTTEGSEGYEKIAAVKSKEATQNHSAVYAALDSLGLDPENKNYYTDENTLKIIEKSYYDLLVEAGKPAISEVPYLDREKLDETKRQHKEQMSVSRGNLAVSQQRANYDMSEKTETSNIKLTPAGEKARQADIKKYGAAHPLANYEHTTTKTTVATKSNSEGNNANKSSSKKETPKERALRLARQ